MKVSNTIQDVTFRRQYLCSRRRKVKEADIVVSQNHVYRSEFR